MTLAEKGAPKSAVMAELEALQRDDAAWEKGRTWAYVYHPGDGLLEVLRDGFLSAFEKNGLSARAFPGLANMEKDVIASAIDLLGGSADATGSITSGGSESILLAVKAHRDRARAISPGISEPEMILPRTAHPAFDKAGHYLGIRPVRIEVDEAQRADMSEVRAAVNDSTILLVGSAPSYPHGVVDPIPEMSALALETGLPLHVDACVGGFLLPFVRRLGRSLPDFDFSLDGVTTISADLHKYGYAAKGASLVLHRSHESFAYQGFTFDGWPGSTYAVPNLTGTRPGGSIAAAWAAMKYLGEEGYLDLTRRALNATDRLVGGIRSLPGGHVVADPAATLFAFGIDGVDLAKVGGELTRRGWVLSLQDSPPSFHLTVSANHDEVVDEFLSDLEDAVTAAGAGETSDRLAAGYN